MLVPPALLVAFAWSFLFFQGFGLVDDAYISFRYVDNFVAGDGLVWNPGQLVEGYTNLLWLLLLAPFAAAGLDLVLPAALLGTAFSIGTLELLRRLTARTLPERGPFTQALPGLLLALNPAFASWTTSGMETPAFAFFVLLAAAELLRERGARRPWLLVLAFCLAYLTRPEGALVAGLLLTAHLLFGAEGPWRLRLREAIYLGLPLLGVVLIHIGIRLSVYGYPLPNTFYAKVIFGGVTLKRGLLHLLGFLAAGGLLVLPGLLLLRAEAPLARTLKTGYVLLGGYTVYLLLIGGDVPPWNRFYVPLLALPLLGLGELLARVINTVRARRPQLLGALAALFAMALTMPGWNYGEVGQIGGIRAGKAVHAVLVQTFFRPLVPKDAFLAVSAVGYIGYYLPNRILDTWGLNDARIAHSGGAAIPAMKFGHDKTDWLYVLSQKPDFVITFEVGGRPPAPARLRALLAHPGGAPDGLLSTHRAARRA
jgi:arabinofuranosyltransferase